MKDFLKKIKLIDTLTIALDTTKSEFVSKFKPHVDEGNIGLFSTFFEVFSSSENEYKGEVRHDGFKIRRRRKFFDTNKNLTIATGTYRQSNDKLIIETEINGFPKIMIPLYIFLLIFFIMFLSFSITLGSTEENNIVLIIPFFIIYMLFIFGIPYFLMRKSVKKMKHDIERELFYIVKK